MVRHPAVKCFLSCHIVYRESEMLAAKLALNCVFSLWNEASDTFGTNLSIIYGTWCCSIIAQLISLLHGEYSPLLKLVIKILRRGSPW